MAKKHPVVSDPYSAKDARSPEALQKAKGFNKTFVNKTIPIDPDLLTKKQKVLLPVVNKKEKGPLNYTGNSVYYNTARMLPFYSAYNIDLDRGSAGKRAPKFIRDKRIDETLQLNYKDFYDLKKGSAEDFDIGHMAGCDEMAWEKDGQLKSLQTFFFPNTSPQAAILNQKLWNAMERALVSAQKGEGKVAVFTGPIMAEDDPVYTRVKTFQVPLRFFKIIVFQYQQQLYSTALVMSHIEIIKSLGLIEETPRMENMKLVVTPSPVDDFPYTGIFQVNVSMVSKLTGIKFSWPNVKPVKVPVKYNTLANIDLNETPADARKNDPRRTGLETMSLKSAVNLRFDDATNPYGFYLVS